jgi:GntR family transcriptional regulator
MHGTWQVTTRPDEHLKEDRVIASTQVRLRADQRPLYAQASEALKNLIQVGGYAAGDRLPSEVELSQRLGISRPTLREALQLLEEDGTIVRRHGVGTFVAPPQPVIEGGLEVLESIERMAERHGLSTHMDAATVEERAATPRELHGLGLIDETAVTVVTRVIITDPLSNAGPRQHIAFLTDVVPVPYLRAADLRAPISAEAAALQEAANPGFSGSVLDLFLGRGWPLLSHSRTGLVAEAADADLARALHIQRNAPLLRMEAQLYAQDGRVVDYSLSHFVPGYFRFHVVRRIG